MKRQILLSALLVAAAFVFAGCGAGAEAGEDGQGEACVDGSGEVVTKSACKSVSAFANNCLIGAHGCGPDDSHKIETCECPAGSCWDGAACTAKSTGTGSTVTTPGEGSEAVDCTTFAAEDCTSHSDLCLWSPAEGETPGSCVHKEKDTDNPNPTPEASTEGE